MSDSATPWTVAYQAPLPMGFPRQGCWSGLLFPSPGDLPDPGIKSGSPALQADALPSEPPGKHWRTGNFTNETKLLFDNLKKSHSHPKIHYNDLFWSHKIFSRSRMDSRIIHYILFSRLPSFPSLGEFLNLSFSFMTLIFLKGTF